MELFKKLSEKLSTKNKKTCNGMIKPIDVNFDTSKNEFLDNLSKKAIKLYEQQHDVKKFTQLVLSDPENLNHNEIVNDLFNKGNLIDPLEDEKLERLADNKRFLRDLGLLD